jgi:hypothetical protein
MSSLQKFHRRTNNAAAAGPLFLTVGSGSDTVGYRLGLASGSSAYLIAAPKSTEVQKAWGGYGTVRGTTSTTNGDLNTGTLYGFGSAAHPAAYYCRTLTTGGYSSWYLPALNELLTLYSNKAAVPFATADSFVNDTYCSSTEQGGNFCLGKSMVTGMTVGVAKDLGNYQNPMFYVRPVRQYYAPATIGDGSSTTGYWLGTAGDGVSKLIVAPASTEVPREWGSYGTVRGTTSTTDGVANTNTLFGFGSAAHPAAYYAKSLTTGGYNSWYLPAKDEVNTLYSNKSATPFATANSFVGSNYWSSSEINNKNVWYQRLDAGSVGNYFDKGTSSYRVRAVRRSTI